MNANRPIKTHSTYHKPSCCHTLTPTHHHTITPTYPNTHTLSQGAHKLRERIDPNEKPTEVPESVQRGVHYTRKATGYVVGVSDYLMLSLAKLTVKVGRQAGKAVANSEVRMYVCLLRIGIGANTV